MIIKFTVKKSYGDYFDKHTIDISQESNDYFSQPLRYFDKIIFASDDGQYKLGYFLGSTASGKNQKVLFIHQGKKLFDIDIRQVGGYRLFRQDWSDTLFDKSFLQKVDDLKNEILSGVPEIMIIN